MDSENSSPRKGEGKRVPSRENILSSHAGTSVADLGWGFVQQEVGELGEKGFLGTQLNSSFGTDRLVPESSSEKIAPAYTVVNWVSPLPPFLSTV